MELESLRAHPRVSVAPETRRAYAADVSGLASVPAAVARPESAAEVADIVRRCAAAGIPLTAQGLRSSTTGAAVPARGIALSLEPMNRLLEIDPRRRIAVAEAGMITAEFKRRVAAAGLFYPPDPTSEEECTLGGNVACNASGSRTYRYGPTRRYVRALEVVLSDGTLVSVPGIRAEKNAAGYQGLQNPVDPWIGSEGTLGVITRVTLALRPAPPAFYAALAFFPDWRAAIDFVLAADRVRQVSGRALRCLEFFDRGALEVIRPTSGGHLIAPDAGAAVYLEEEVPPTQAMAALERWQPLIVRSGGTPAQVIVARTPEELRGLRELRHAVPATMNERGAQAADAGGRRVSTDFAVSLSQLPTLMEDAYGMIAEGFRGESIAYGHLGSGHPHFNLLAPDAAALEAATETARRMTRRAIELGGTLSAEHGIGKLKAGLWREVCPAWLYRAARALKDALDPAGLLAPGNIFE